MPTAHELVARGAELLDEKLPGWADQIDLDSLNMAVSCNCVLGQLGAETVNLDLVGWHEECSSGSGNIYNRNYVRMLEGLDIRHEEHMFGFEGYNGILYADLQDAWQGEIVARRTLGDVS